MGQLLPILLTLRFQSLDFVTKSVYIQIIANKNRDSAHPYLSTDESSALPFPMRFLCSDSSTQI